jgi:hypothetical protein
LFVVEFSGLISGFGEFDCSLPLFVSSVRESLFFKGGHFTREYIKSNGLSSKEKMYL